MFLVDPMRVTLLLLMLLIRLLHDVGFIPQLTFTGWTEAVRLAGIGHPGLAAHVAELRFALAGDVVAASRLRPRARICEIVRGTLQAIWVPSCGRETSAKH